MRKILVVLLILLVSSVVYAERVVTITTTKISNVNVINNEAGQVSVNGEVIDSDGNIVKSFYRIYTFDELPVQIRNNLNNVMKHFSRDMNSLGADEDSETWVDK